MKKFFLITMIILPLGLISCSSNKVQEATEKGILAMASENFDEALSSLKIAKEKNKNGETTKIDDLISIIESYKKAKESFDNKNYIESKKILDEISESYKTYSIKDKVDSLIENIKEATTNEEDATTSINTATEFMTKGNYSKAAEELSSINKNYLTDKTLNSISDLNNKIANEKKTLELKKEKEREEMEKQKEIALKEKGSKKALFSSRIKEIKNNLNRVDTRYSNSELSNGEHSNEKFKVLDKSTALKNEIVSYIKSFSSDTTKNKLLDEDSKFENKKKQARKAIEDKYGDGTGAGSAIPHELINLNLEQCTKLINQHL